MKRHFLGMVIFLVAIAIGLIISPIHFELNAMGHGFVKDGGGFYWSHRYTSMYFVSLSNMGEGYETSQKAQEVFQNQLKDSDNKEIVNQKVLEQSENRAVVYFQRNDNIKGYCVMRVEKNSLDRVCSNSLWHVLEFEKQNYK